MNATIPGQMWVVTWRQNGELCVLDFDDRDAAVAAGAWMAEHGRRDVLLSEHSIEVEPEQVEAARKAVKEAVWGRLSRTAWQQAQDTGPASDAVAPRGKGAIA